MGRVGGNADGISLGRTQLSPNELVAVRSVELFVHFADLPERMADQFGVPCDLPVETFDLLLAELSVGGEDLAVDTGVVVREGQTFLSLEILILQGLLAGHLFLAERPVGAGLAVDVDEGPHQVVVGSESAVVNLFLALLVEQVGVLVLQAVVDGRLGDQQLAVVGGAVQHVVVEASPAVLDEGVHPILYCFEI